MPDVYGPKEVAVIKLLCSRVYNKCKKDGLSYRQIGILVKAQPGTIWRWFHSKSTPSRHHIHYMKVFMGYTVE